MKYCGFNKTNILAIAAAAIFTILLRHFVFTPDSNLLIVGVSFLIIYTMIYAIVNLLKR